MKKLFYKLFSKAERALMMKDLSALCRRRLILTLLIALPLVFAVAFPLLFLFVSAMVSPESSGVEQFKNLLDNIPQGTDERAQMFYIFTAFISPMLFMLIPLYRQSLRLRTRLRASGHTAQWKRFCLRRSACAAFCR